MEVSKLMILGLISFPIILFVLSMVVGNQTATISRVEKIKQEITEVETNTTEIKRVIVDGG